jgi:hypothetical protein
MIRSIIGKFYHLVGSSVLYLAISIIGLVVLRLRSRIIGDLNTSVVMLLISIQIIQLWTLPGKCRDFLQTPRFSILTTIYAVTKEC